MAEKKFIVVKLYFKSGLHLSQGKEDNYDRSQMRLHSDTLKSALFVAALGLFPELSMENYEESDTEESFPYQRAFFRQFRVSSAFPFLDHRGKTLYFLPKPLKGFNLELLNEEGIEDRKLYSKIQYMEKDTLLDAFQGKLVLDGTSNYSDDRKFLAKGVDLTKGKIFRNEVQQHVAIPRTGDEDGSPFHVDKIFFEKGAGLYFLLEADDEKWVNKVAAALRLLGDSGMGTDRTMGGGQFSAKIEKEPFAWPFDEEKADFQMNLSLYWPRKEEVAAITDAAYKLTRRGGFLANPSDNSHLTIRKKSVYMFEEGGVFPAGHQLKGRVGDLCPDNSLLKKAGIPTVNHPVWRDGQAIFLPF